MKKTVLVSGGAGYIGSHTIIELFKEGYEIDIVDNLSNSKEEVLDRIEKISGKRPGFYQVDICDGKALDDVFKKNQYDLVIHFAGLKAVGESVKIPIKYYRNNIDSTLRKRFDLLNKSIGIIKANTDKEKVLDIIVNLRSKKFTNFELDRKLYEAINEFSKYKEDYPKLKKNDEYMKIDLGLSETEAEIVASRKYYNDIITDYNKLVRNFPSNIVAKLSKQNVRTYFDGKDMEDDITDDFKL